MDSSPDGISLMAVCAISGSVALLAFQAHRRLLSDFMTRMQQELCGIYVIGSSCLCFLQILQIDTSPHRGSCVYLHRIREIRGQKARGSFRRQHDNGVNTIRGGISRYWASEIRPNNRADDACKPASLVQRDTAVQELLQGASHPRFLRNVTLWFLMRTIHKIFVMG